MLELNNNVTYEPTGLKVSYKMRNTIERMFKIYGAMNKHYFIERMECNRVGRGFYDGCELTDDVIKGRKIIVAHDGTYCVYGG